MYLVAYWHGLRASEVIAIKPDDIRDGFLSVHRLKGSLHTTQPLMFHVEPLLNEHDALIELATRTPPNQLLFKMCREHFSRKFKRYARAVGVPAHKCHPHALKHSIAMQIVGKVGVENTRIWLGHRSLASTGEYAKPSEADAAAAVIGSLSH